MCFVAISLAAAPTLISTAPGTQAIAAAASVCVPGRVAIQRIDVGWNAPTRIEGVSVSQQIGNIGTVDVVRVGEITSRASLKDLILGAHPQYLRLIRPV